MTDEEFDEFLLSIGGLKNGFYPDRPNIVSSGICSTGNGWFGIVKRLIEDLIALGWNKEICQIKEKFGGLRFYINEGSDQMHARINEAEKESYLICEKCGEPGEHRTDRGWWATLCDEHNMKQN